MAVPFTMDLSKILTPADGVATLAHLERLESDLEMELKQVKVVIHELETKRLVELFDDAGMTGSHSFGDVTVRKGLSVTGSLPKPGDKDTPEEASTKLAQRTAALDWAHANGWGPFIKSIIKAEWDKGDSAKADALIEHLRGDNSVKLSRDDGIHAMTLQSQARKRYEKGLETPFALLGVEVLPAVKITKKPKKEV